MANHLSSKLIAINTAEKGFTSLHIAARNRLAELVKRLLKRGAKINIVDDSGRSPLHYAVENIDLDIIKLLVDNGATGDGRPNALFPAVETSREDVVELILRVNSNVDSNAARSSDKTTSRSTLRCSSPDNSSERDDSAKNTARVDDAKRKISKVSLPSEVRVNARTDGVVTATNFPDRQGYPKIFKRNANVNCLNEAKSTPLHIATERGNETIVEMLLNKGARINAKRADGNTALHLAIESSEAKIVRILVNQGADIYARNNEGSASLHAAAACDNVTIFSIVINACDDIDCRDKNGKTPLHIASENELYRNVEMLIERDADVNATCNAGKSPHDYSLLSIKCSWTAGIIEHHVVMMIALERHVSEKNVQMINNRPGSYQNKWIRATAEVECMKKIYIGDSKMSFYNFLMNGIHRLPFYARNDSVAKVLESLKYANIFPYYSRMIDFRFKKAKRRNDLLPLTLKSFNSLSGYLLSDYATAEVLNYLSNVDLINIIKACTHDE